MIRLIVVLSFIFVLFPFCFSAFSEEKNLTYTDELVAKAFDTGLDKDPYWHTLIHYEKKMFGIRSQIDDPGFFLSENGKVDPKSELEASIRAFFSNGPDEDMPDVCQYIARYDWLLQKLDVDPSKVQIYKCEPVDNIHPLKAYLIFPSASINSPASMFGHTFLNVKTTNRSDLLSHAVNYAARSEESNGIVFAFGALVGMYKGDYSVLPYYKKIQEYTDMDKRDMWEYELNLDEAELRKMVRHIREMEKVNIDYYFFDDNCAYNILYLIDSARPSAGLVDKSWFFTIPTDTIVDAYDAGLVTGKNFRPSKATKIRQKIKVMDENLKTAAFDIKNGKREASEIDEISSVRADKIRVLDLATETLQYDYLARNITKEDYSKRFVNILRERSKLGAEEPGMSNYPFPKSPDTYHRPKRISIGGGGADNEKGFYEMGIRFAYNDVCDPDYPVETGSQIQFGNTRIRYDNETNEFGFEQIDIIDLLSLSPRDEFFKPWSWSFRTGFKKEMTSVDGKRELFWQNIGGVGLTTSFADKFLIYGLAQLEFDTDDALEQGWTAGSGLLAGMIWQVSDPYKIMIEGNSVWFGLGDTHEKHSLRTVHRFRLSKNVHFGVDAEKTFTYDFNRSEVSAKFDFYF